MQTPLVNHGYHRETSIHSEPKTLGLARIQSHRARCVCWLWRVCKWVGAKLADKEATAVVMSIISGPRQIYVEQGEDPHHTGGRHREVRERSGQVRGDEHRRERGERERLQEHTDESGSS